MSPRSTAPRAAGAPRPVRSRRPAVVRRLALTPHASRQLDRLAERWGLPPFAIVSIAVDAWARREAALEEAARDGGDHTPRPDAAARPMP